MRSLTFAILTLAVAASAQTPKSAAPATKPSTKSVAPKTTSKTTTPAAKTAAKPAAPAKAPAKTQAAAKPAVKAPAAKTNAAAPVAKPAAPPKSIAPEVARNRRDPFISPVRLQEERMRSNPACTTGARCLVISQVVLKGVVKTQNGWIAMVENAAKKQYNLHEKDSVQNGFVLKITGDSIVFQETVTDPLGRPVTKEVVKRVTAPAV